MTNVAAHSSPPSRRPAAVPPAAAGDAVALAVALAQRGDREGLRLLYVRYAETVRRYARSIVWDDHEAEDVAQHVFAKVMTVIGQYERRDAAFTAWLLRLAHNTAVDHLRVRRPSPVADVSDVPRRYDDAGGDRALDVREALAALPADQREVVILRHVVGMSPPEIAERLGRSESSIHGLHHRGRRALKEELMRANCGPSTRRKAAA